MCIDFNFLEKRAEHNGVLKCISSREKLECSFASPQRGYKKTADFMQFHPKRMKITAAYKNACNMGFVDVINDHGVMEVVPYPCEPYGCCGCCCLCCDHPLGTCMREILIKKDENRTY